MYAESRHMRRDETPLIAHVAPELLADAELVETAVVSLGLPSDFKIAAPSVSSDDVLVVLRLLHKASAIFGRSEMHCLPQLLSYAGYSVFDDAHFMLEAVKA